MIRVTAALCWVALLSGCSLMGLDDYDQIACNQDETNGSPECDHLNALLPAGSCGRYYCDRSSKGCHYEERREPETCDGIDNNCNGYIDEGVEFSREEESFDETDIKRVSAAASDDGALHLLLAPLQRDGEVMRRMISGSEIGSRGRAFDDSQCTAPPLAAARHCNMDQLTVAAARHVVVAAGIHLGDCNDGQLRLGAASPPKQLPMGDDPDARVSFGIDVDPEGTRACSRSTECDGASDPALALWTAEGPGASEGLLLWRAPTHAAACDRFQLAGLGFTVEPSEGTFVRLRLHDATTRVSEAPVVGPPAITALRSVGYAAAFPSDDEVVLLLLPPTADLEVVEVFDEMRLSASQPSDIALASREGDHSKLGVAYRSRTAEGDSLVFEAVEVGDKSFEKRRERRELPLQGALVGSPALAYSASGFLSGVSGEPEGGFWLFWIEQAADPRDEDHTLFAARIAEHGQHVLNEHISLASGPIGQVFTYSKHEAYEKGPSFGFLTDRAVHLGSPLCEN